MSKPSREAREATELLVEILHVQKRRFQTVAKDNALSMQQAATLTSLVPGETMPMSGLADVLMCDASNVTGIIDKLEARGLLRREAAEDRRVKVIRLTPEGEALRHAMRERLLEPPDWLAGLGRDELRSLRDILRKATELARPKP
jgi:MarR family transcriptional regulator, organic hydroperoxide resistance regulator